KLHQCRGEWPSGYALTPLPPACNTMAWFYAAEWPTFAPPLTAAPYRLSLKVTFDQIDEIYLCFQKQKYLTVRQSSTLDGNIFHVHFQ
ncbi:hypothetical protein OSJ57_20420, partial [Sphingomonas sp. HH69]